MINDRYCHSFRVSRQSENHKTTSELSKKQSAKASRRASCYDSVPDNPRRDAFGLDFFDFLDSPESSEQ